MGIHGKTAVAVLLLTLTGGAWASELRLYLPRNASVSDKTVTLGQIAVPFGEEELASAASAVRLGTITLPDQELTIDRYTIMTRLGSSGIDTSAIRLSGAERVKVRLGELRFTPEELMIEAERFAQILPIESGMRLHILDMPEELTVKNSGRISFVPELAGQAGKELLTVRLSIMRDGEKIAERKVRFTRVPRKVKSESAAPQNRKPREAARFDRNADKIVSRNQPVLIVVDLPGLQVTAMGVALTDGREGELIKVRNMDSKRDVVVQVRPDGNVSPVF